jgi:ADP-ribosyl-[dinitrogen reductase] hydrolase
MDSLRDNVAGCLIGLAVGDALGVPHEFKTQKNNVYTGLLEIIPVFSFRSGKRTDVIGQYSDDTEMTLTLLRSIVENKGYKRDSVISAYMNWAMTAKAMGKNTRALFKGIKTVRGYSARYKKIFTDTSPDTWTQSNGSLMRCSILGFLNNEDVVIEDCKLSNPHQVNIDCNLAYCLIINNTSQGICNDEILELLRSQDYCDTVKEIIEDAVNSTERDVTENKGWVLHAFYCAIWGWYHFDSYQEAIDAIISFAGDTDTNAAIAGALLGAKLGFDKLKAEERTSQNIQTVFDADFNLGENPRPNCLLLKDFDQLVNNFINLL